MEYYYIIVANDSNALLYAKELIVALNDGCEIHCAKTGANAVHYILRKAT